MALTLVTAATDRPVDLTTAKGWLRVDLSDDNALIDDLIADATAQFEQDTACAILTQTWDYTLDGFPDQPCIVLPVLPLVSVTSITYTDSAGGATVWPSNKYLVDASSRPGRIVPAYGETWPSFTPRPINAVAIRFVAGWATPADVPPSISRAILTLVAHWFENREAINATPGAFPRDTPYAYGRLMERWRLLNRSVY